MPHNCNQCVSQPVCQCSQPCAPTPCTDGCLTDTKSKCVFLSSDIEICGTTYVSGTDLNEVIQAIEACIQNGVPAANDIFVKISANDQTSSYLENKLQGSNCLTVTKQNIGANEYLLISPKISAQPGNIIQCLADGLYASVTTQTPTPATKVLELDTNSVDMTVQYNGTDTYTVSANVRVCQGANYTDNILEIIPGCGLYVKEPTIANQININQCNTSQSINQSVVLAGSTYTLCHEVNTPGIISSDANNCLILGADNKLYVGCVTTGQVDMVTNVVLNGTTGTLDFTGVGGAFSGSVCLIDPTVGNLITAGPNGCLYVDPNSIVSNNLIKIDATDTCPGNLDDKIITTLADINPLGSLPGIGAYTWTQVVSGSGNCFATNNLTVITDIVNIIIDGITYPNASPFGAITTISDAVDILQWIIDNDPTLTADGWMASSTNAGQLGIPPDVQDIFLFGPGGVTVVITYNYCYNGINAFVPAQEDLTSTYDLNKILPDFKFPVFKEIEDDGSGCKIMRLSAYNKFGKPEDKFVKATPTDACAGTLLDKLVPTGGITITPFTDLSGCDKLEIGLLGTPCDTTWTNIPNSAFLNGWGSDTNFPAQFKIKNDILYFRGSMIKSQFFVGSCNSVSPGQTYAGSTPEDILNLNVFASCLNLSGKDNFGIEQLTFSIVHDSECGAGFEAVPAHIIGNVTRNINIMTILMEAVLFQDETMTVTVPLSNKHIIK